MQNFQDSFETHKRSFTSTFPICMTVPLRSPNESFFLEGNRRQRFCKPNNSHCTKNEVFHLRFIW